MSRLCLVATKHVLIRVAKRCQSCWSTSAHVMGVPSVAASCATVYVYIYIGCIHCGFGLISLTVSCSCLPYYGPCRLNQSLNQSMLCDYCFCPIPAVINFQNNDTALWSTMSRRSEEYPEWNNVAGDLTCQCKSSLSVCLTRMTKS